MVLAPRASYYRPMPKSRPAYNQAELPQLPDHAAIEAAWQQLRRMRRSADLASAEMRGQVLRTIGVAVVSPAGVPIVRSGPGPREDAGRVRLRARAGLEDFFRQALEG